MFKDYFLPKVENPMSSNDFNLLGKNCINFSLDYFENHAVGLEKSAIKEQLIN